jgi:copper(I)-binding protein
MRMLVIPFAVLALIGAGPVLAADPVPAPKAQPAGVTVQDAWARASAGAATTGAAYVTLKGGAEADRLVSVSTPLTRMAQVHESSMEGGMMRMREVPGIAIPPGQTVTFKPGGYHVMLMELKAPLKAGETFPLTLTFEHAAPVTVSVPVRPIGAAAPGMKDTMPMK